MSDTISARWCNRELIVMKRCYCLVLDEAAYYEECNRYGVPVGDQGVWLNEGANATATYLTSGAGEPIAIVAIDVDDTRTPIQVAGLLVHEAVHLVQRFCTDIGEHQPGAEFQAYATQWISQELMEQYVSQTAAARLAAHHQEKTVKPTNEKPAIKGEKPIPKGAGKKGVKAPATPGAKMAPPFGKKGAKK